MTQKPMWFGERPAKCDLCGAHFKSRDHFIDGRTVYGPWGIMCDGCHARHGCGLGTGKGQRYSWDTLEKVEG